MYLILISLYVVGAMIAFGRICGELRSQMDQDGKVSMNLAGLVKIILLIVFWPFYLGISAS